MRMRAQDVEDWPHLLLLLGDQVYADEVPVSTAEFIAARRDPSVPPGYEVADFEEYCRLYRDSWSRARRPLAALDRADGDDLRRPRRPRRLEHVEATGSTDIRAQGWWDERIVGGFMAYWVYQHLGNLSPEDRMDDATLPRRARGDGDAGPIVREFAFAADREVAGARWSYRRDLGRTRIVMMDSRAGRVLEPGARHMVDAEEWDCIERWTRGSFDHLLLGTSLPAFLGRGMHYLEAWNEAVCEGAWGRAARAGRASAPARLDLEHWAAFGDSLRDLEDLLERIACGRHGEAARRERRPALRRRPPRLPRARRGSRRATAAAAPVYQAVCSPLRNPLDSRERRAIRIGMSRAGRARRPCARPRRGGGARNRSSWTIEEGPWFDNQVATLELDGRRGWMVLDKTGEPAGRAAAARAGDATATVLTRGKAGSLAGWRGGWTTTSVAGAARAHA